MATAAGDGGAGARAASAAVACIAHPRKLAARRPSRAGGFRIVGGIMNNNLVAAAAGASARPQSWGRRRGERMLCDMLPAPPEHLGRRGRL